MLILTLGSLWTYSQIIPIKIFEGDTVALVPIERIKVATLKMAQGAKCDTLLQYYDSLTINLNVRINNQRNIITLKDTTITKLEKVVKANNHITELDKYKINYLNKLLDKQEKKYKVTVASGVLIIIISLLL